MKQPHAAGADDPEALIRKVAEGCVDCDECRYHMEEVCRFFPELYRLYDRGEPPSGADLRDLVELCNFCGLCPCPDIRRDLMLAKTGIARRDGLPVGVRLLQDVGRIGRVCGALPRLTNFLAAGRATGAIVRRAAGIHPDRRLPAFPDQPFPAGGPEAATSEDSKPKVAYFVGCTGRYLFPDVPKAATGLLRELGAEVRIIEPACCGMPPLLEGDRQLALRLAEASLDQLRRAVDDGCDIVCSCPTCGYMLKQVILEGAWYAPAVQDRIGGDPDHIKVPVSLRPGPDGRRDYRLLKRSIYGKILKDDGYFSNLDPVTRTAVAERTHDLGEYLAGAAGADFPPAEDSPARPDTDEVRVVYFPPCHLREQKIGTPYADLLAEMPGLSVETVPGSFHCCGMAGIMGFKKSFHRASLEMGAPLMATINRLKPDLIATDCLSCRLQLNQMSSTPVRHPVELLHGTP